MRADRLKRMKEYIEEHGNVTMEQLCKSFGVSINTVRRDLAGLQETGEIQKIYGGVMSTQNRNLLYFDKRSEMNYDEKRRIGAKAAELVSDGDVIFIDSGTTTSEMVPHLISKKVTIITGSLPVIRYAAGQENICLIVLPGIYDSHINSMTGGDTANYLKKFNVDSAFMAASGFVPAIGATHASMQEYDVKRCAIERSDNVYLMIDHSKLGNATLINYAATEELTALITGEEPDEQMKTACEEKNMTIIMALEDK
ncbi:MAG: DeoR/GlpR family DNA-binding transcription regulator [Clostridiaceae bacterium]